MDEVREVCESMNSTDSRHDAAFYYFSALIKTCELHTEYY